MEYPIEFDHKGRQFRVIEREYKAGEGDDSGQTLALRVLELNEPTDPVGDDEEMPTELIPVEVLKPAIDLDPEADIDEDYVIGKVREMLDLTVTA